MNTAPNIDPAVTSAEGSPQLPSIKDTLLRPKVLLASLVFSIVLNVVLLIAVILVGGSKRSPAVSPTTTSTPVRTSGSPTTTARPSPRPSFTPDEALVEWQDCFHNCNVEDLLAGIRSKAVDYTDFKAQISFRNDKSRTCYGNYLESSNSFKEFNSYQFQNCPENYLSRPPQTTIQIADNIYTLNISGNWNLDSMPRVSQTKLIRVIDEVTKQQEKTVGEHAGKSTLKEIETTSKTVNELNQLVTKTATLVITEYLDVISYEIEVENISNESGYFFGLGVVNTIEAPL